MSINDPDFPDAYKQGWVEFCGLRFEVTPDVLIPRPETEALVDEVVKFAPLSVVDVGTGSGCVAISIAKKLPNVKVTAIDVSEKALEVAKRNSKTHGVEEQVTFMQNDLLENFYDKTDVIVANLPYIPSSKISNLDRSVKDFEPVLALDGGPDGFDLYRKLFAQIVKNNIRPKLLIIEIDDFQDQIALNEAKKHFPDQQTEILKDFSNFNRLLIIR